MGQTTSKEPPSSTKHIFQDNSPVHFAPQVVEALEASPETDSTRASDLELHIQARVHEELARLEAEQDKRIREIAQRLSEPEPTPDKGLHIPGLTGTKEDPHKDLGRDSVMKEIEELRRKLKARRLREEVVGDKDVEKAKSELVTCLRTNDRRPLDCWKEVEAFKIEVGKLEKAFLGRVLD